MNADRPRKPTPSIIRAFSRQPKVSHPPRAPRRLTSPAHRSTFLSRSPPCPFLYLLPQSASFCFRRAIEHGEKETNIIILIQADFNNFYHNHHSSPDRFTSPSKRASIKYSLGLA